MIEDDIEFEYHDDTEEDINIKPHIVNAENKSEYCCRNKCILWFDDDFKLCLKNDLSLLNKIQKRIYLFAMISINEEKKSCPLAMKSSKYFEYTVKEYGISRSVCKNAFITLHDTTPALVRTLCLKMSANCLIPTDERGKHKNDPFINKEMENLIKQHMLEILESPAIMKCCKKNMGQPNVYKLWLDFKEKYDNITLPAYRKYAEKLITPDIEAKFMCARIAKDMFEKLNKKQKKKRNTKA